MKVLLILSILFLSACAKIEVKKEGEDWDISYNVLWRNVEDVEAKVGNTYFRLGKANSDDPVEEIVLESGRVLKYIGPEEGG